jgi:hypothetical protein
VKLRLSCLIQELRFVLYRTQLDLLAKGDYIAALSSGLRRSGGDTFRALLSYSGVSGHSLRLA